MLYLSIILLFPLMQIIFFLTIFNGIIKVIDRNGGGGGDTDDALNRIIGVMFPALTIMGILVSGGAFIVTPVKDREHKVRYLLNFAGMRPVAYYIGLFLADYILYFIPISLLMVVA